MTPHALWMAAVEYTQVGLRLHAAERLPYPESGEQPFTIAHQILCRWLEQLPVTPTTLHVALSPELATLVHTFPLETPADAEQLLEATELELQYFVAEYGRQHYTTFILPLGQEGNKRRDVLTITYNRSELEFLRAPCGSGLSTTLLPDCFGIPALWRYNYPDYAERNVLLLHLQPPYIDIFLLAHGHMVLFRTVPAADDGTPETLVHQCFELLSGDRIGQLPPLEGVFLFGQAVHRRLIELLQERLSPQTQAVVSRLNAFRMYLPPADLRLRHYAIRTAHLFWGCAGVCLPPESGVLVL